MRDHRILVGATFVALVLGLTPSVASAGGTSGACCQFDGACVTATEAQCRAIGGDYQGDGTTCADVSCPTYGACCIPFDECVVTTIVECFGDLGGLVWAPEQVCDGAYECPSFGACCRPDGSCSIRTQFTCEFYGAAYQGDGVDCGDADCPATCPDFDGSGDVGLSDLLAVLSQWGFVEPCPPSVPGDVDLDCHVGFDDLQYVLSHWGPCAG